MRRVVTCLAIAAAWVAISVPAYARTVDLVIPLGSIAEGTVVSGKAKTIGVLIPAGARRVTATVQWARKSGLDPVLRVFGPDGSEITPAALEVAGGRWKTTSTRISLKRLPAPESGLYKFVLRGLDDTAGDYRLKCRGRPAKYARTEDTLETPAAFDEFRIDVPDGSLLSVVLRPSRKSELVPDLEIRTAGEQALDFSDFVRRRKAKTTLRKLPLPYFGGYVLKVVSAEGSGGYRLSVKVRSKKIKVDPARPIADAGGVAVIGPGEKTILAGDGSLGATFAWERVSGRGPALTDPATATPSFTAEEEGGTHAFQLVTTLNGISSIADTAVIEVNQPPVAVGGPSYTVAPGATVTLDGTESFDLDSDATLDFLWRQVSGPSVSLQDSTGAIASFTAPAGAGVLVFELVVDDGSLSSVADRVVVGVNRVVADAGRPVIITPEDSAWLSGLRTPGTPDEFAWSRVDSNSPTFELAVTEAPITAFSAPREPGIYRFRLEVDGESASADEVIVIVSRLAGNGEPRAAAGGVTTTSTDTAFELSGGMSSDPDGDTLTFEWRQDDGEETPVTGSGATRSGTTPTSDDVLRFLLMVHDGRKYGPPDQVTIISGSPEAPVANAWIDASGAPGDTISLDSSRSSASTGRTIASRQWTQLTGLDLYDVASDDAGFDATAIAPVVTVPLAVSSLTPDRSMIFALVVTDDTGAVSGHDLVVVTFEDLPRNAAPSVTAEASADPVRPGTQVSLTGTAEDRDGDTLTYVWEQVSGPETVPLSGDTSATATLTAPATSGNYVFRVTVSDGTGEPNGTAIAIARFRVNAAPVIVAAVTPPSAPAGANVALDGSGTSDPEGETLTYTWSEVISAGNVPVAITGNQTSQAAFIVQPYANGRTIAQRTRTFRLTVSDSMGSVTKDVTFVPNVAPTTAGMTVSKLKIRYDNTDAAVFTLPGLTDPDGDPVTATWRIVSGPSTSGATLSSASGTSTSLTVATPTAQLASTGGIWVVGVTLTDGVATPPETTTSILAYPSYASDVWPILSTSCATANCHGVAATAAGTILYMPNAATTRLSLVNVGSNGSGNLRVAPNNHSMSWLWIRVNNATMPVGGPKLAQWQIDIIRDWIEPEGLGAAGTMSPGAENN